MPARKDDGAMERGLLCMLVMGVAFMSMSAVSAYGYDSTRIMTFNICHCATHHSLGVTDEDVRRTASVIAAESPDFVCLQEVDRCTTRSDGIDQTARLAELLTEKTGDRYYGTFGRGRDYQGGEFGVAVLAKCEPLSVSTTPLEGSEPRVLLVCEFEEFCVATVHLDTDKTFRLNSISDIQAALETYSKPVFVSGDWNATPTSDATLAQMKGFLTVISPESGIRTFGDINGADYVIDYIAVDTANCEKFYVQRGYCVSNIVDEHGSSDHNPVIVDVVKRPETLGWVDESFLTTGRTGTWSPSVAWNGSTWTADLSGDRVFTPAAPSGGNRVTMTVTASFDAVPNEYDAPGNTAQGAVWLGTNGCFQVWTCVATAPSPSGGGNDGEGAVAAQNGWIDVEAEGVTPQTGVEYTFRFVFDYRKGMYSVAVQYGAEWRPLVGRDLLIAPTSFPLAVSASRVSRVKFTGDGVFRSLLGEWVERAAGFHLMIR